jgi:hypothetical protein
LSREQKDFRFAAILLVIGVAGTAILVLAADWQVDTWVEWTAIGAAGCVLWWLLFRLSYRIGYTRRLTNFFFSVILVMAGLYFFTN